MAWETKRVFIVVKTYPNPAHKGTEVSCTAAITEQGTWMRPFPVPFRLLDENRQFPRYSWIDVSVQKASDSRPESFNLNPDSIQIVREVGTAHMWRERKDLILPLKRHCLCCIKQEQQTQGAKAPTLGVFKPAAIEWLSIDPCAADWNAEEKMILSQKGFEFSKMPETPLQKVPFDFRYRFRCPEQNCNGHEPKCLDWELYQAYRSWSKKYGADWRAKLKQRFEQDVISNRDTYFFVGTFRAHPREWGIVGLFLPMPDPQALFDFQQH
jgi:hypothetical protein